MAVFRYKGSKVWTMDFLFHAQRIRESTGTRSKTLALKIEDQGGDGRWKRARRASGSSGNPSYSRLRRMNGWT
jgi:hypothetical protein